MVNARPHHNDSHDSHDPRDPGPGPNPGPAAHGPDPDRPPSIGGRLNLLLSSAPWDRESWADRLSPLLEPIGVRALHARSGREAREVIERQPIHIAVVDLALPLTGPITDQHPLHPGPAFDSAFDPAFDEGGSKLLQVLARLATPPPTLVIKRARTTRDDRRELAAALRAGAFAVLDRPRSTRDIELMLEALRRCLLRHYANKWPRT